MAKKKPYRFFLYLSARLWAGIFGLLPRPVLLMLARGLGSLSYNVISRQRNFTLTHLREAYAGQKTEAEIRVMAKQVMQNMTQTTAELLKVPSITFEKAMGFVEAGNAFEVYQSLLKEGNGLISMTAHIGSWDLLAGIFGLRGFQGAVLARRIYYEPYNQWVVGLRSRMNVRTIYRDGASREILDILAKNQIVGLLPDQDIEGIRGVFVPFFGRPAYTPVAPVRLALSSGAPIVCNFMIRQPGDRYKIVLGNVIRPKIEGSRDEAVQHYTALWMNEFEKVIRMYPEQWAWMHNRWKTKPEKVQKEISGMMN